MKLSDLDILKLMEFFESVFNRAATIDKQQKIRLRRKVRNELYNMLAFEIISADAVLKRWEERLYDIFLIAPYGFKEELIQMLINILTPAFTRKI